MSISVLLNLMKIAISGKGGVGKTTIAASLAHSFANTHYQVICIDCDPDANLKELLGFSEDITPISELKELIKERTGYDEKVGLFKLNPEVGDIPEKYCLRKDNIKLLLMGTIEKGGAGCSCPENTFIKALLTHLLLKEDEVLILDMPAGIEHLGRGTAQLVDYLFIVVEPTILSITTAKKIKKLATDLKIRNIIIVGNKIEDEDDKEFIKNNLKGEIIIDFIEFNKKASINVEKIRQLLIEQYYL